MTHDELLELIAANEEFYGDGTNRTPSWTALRAVVELHTPFEKTIDETTYLFCAKCTDLANIPIIYPCEDVQVIEKELR